MIKAKLAVCGEKVIRDAVSNKISIVNIIETIKSPGFPLFIPELTCLFITERSQKDPENIDCFTRFALDKKELNIVPGKISYTDKLLNRFILIINGLVISKPGTLRVSLFLKENNKEIAFWKIVIKKIGELAKKEQSQI
jgi:hypothetical protein